MDVIALLFLCFSGIAAGTRNPAEFVGHISINCGSTGNSAGPSNREWLGDVSAKSSSLLKIGGSSTTSTIVRNKLIADKNTVPYRTARISRSQFSYTLPSNSGEKILRLHFNPAQYKGFIGFKDLFTVEVGHFTLLGNFSASLTAQALGVNSIVKEFSLYLQHDEQLDIIFTPTSSSPLLDTYAFINGIEIISMPSSLSYFHGGDIRVQVVGQKSQVSVDYNTALELIHRLHVRQISDTIIRDLDHMLPMWITQKANKAKNSTWRIPVEVGFRYMVRLHFSQMGLKIMGSDELMFKVLINEVVAHTNVDISNGTNGNDIPWYVDYVVVMRGHKKQVKRDLVICLHKYDEFIDGSGLLAGFEVFKLSNPDDSLASPNPMHHSQDTAPSTVQTLFSVFGRRYVLLNFLIIILSSVNVVGHKLRESWEVDTYKEENKPSVRAQRLCRRFSLFEIQLATRNFSDALLIGRGGFGKVYKGMIDNGETTVAIKRLKSNSSQGAHEFLTEIETLSELRHYNLVSLIGYCNEHGEMILVYDYMAGGTLADHLFKFPQESNNGSNYSLTWKQRLNICIGAARGLDYLHTGNGVIHRDVKASNILLDENFIAKVSDFGLAKHEDRNKLESHVSTRVKGTRGYFDPHYINTYKLTRKSDTYAFGVVLLETLCGRPAVDFTLPDDEQILTRWARENIDKGNIKKIVSSSLRDEVSEDSLRSFMGVAERCLQDEPKQRPTMTQVVLELEFVLELQDNHRQVSGTEMEHFPDNNRVDLLVNTGQPTLVPSDVPNPTSTPRDQTNLEPVIISENSSGRKDRKKAWSWEAMWSRIKPSNKNEPLLEDIHEEIIKITRFDWRTLAAATNDFLISNRIGQGGFGFVYKGVLPTGQIIAVKRCSVSSRQGIEEFKNEIRLLPNLQHKNIIKLLGYCFHKGEKMVVYEFMVNRSADRYMDKPQGQHLSWSVRFKIIVGIAQGVVYLHQDCGLHVIYRDLKLSNILLDVEMNPKISDFALAKITGEDEFELVTSRIAGTLGYMCPRYCIEGKFSIKSDVYSFGMIVLEIVSGRRSSTWNQILCDIGPMTLPHHAWSLWNEGRAAELIDGSLVNTVTMEEPLRCILIALLCTQDNPHDRPTMPSVLKMLEGVEPVLEPRAPSTMFMWLPMLTPQSSGGLNHSDATYEFDDTLQSFCRCRKRT